MTAGLRETLHRAADDLPSYDVYDRAVRTARRARRRRLAAVAATVVVLGLAAFSWLPTLAAAPANPAGPAEAPAGALPDRVGVPPLGTLHATDLPRLGPAAVLFSGIADGLDPGGERGVIGIVAATDDRYRVLHAGPTAAAGARVLLSPDGRRIAYGGSARTGVTLVDLASGATRRLRPGVRDGVASGPVAWAPGGDRLLLSTEVPADPHRSTYRTVLSVAALDGRPPVEVARADGGADVGTLAAFTGDGGRVAYQLGRRIAVADAATGRPVSAFDLPTGAHLAGKRAWSPDGSALTLAVLAGDGWTLRQVDAVTGAPRDGSWPRVVDAAAIRLLGWGPGGTAAVVVYEPAAATRPRPDEPLEERTSHERVRTVRVATLTPGAAAATTVLTAPDGVSAIDVADAVVAGGRVRAADPPRLAGGRFWYGLALAVVVALGLGVVAVRRRMRERPPGGSPMRRW